MWNCIYELYTFIHISNVCFFYLTHSCFYNIAKDPPASDPRAHQAELGYTILQGPYEGQVDINAELSSITDSVKSSGRATAATFWDVNSVFNRLHDGHVTLPQFRNDSLLTPATLFYIPERCQNGSVTGRHEFTTGSDGELMLKMFWKYENKTEEEEEESIVKSLNGMDVYSFFSEVSNSPSINLVYQSIGARFNALLQGYRTNHKSVAAVFEDTYGTGVYLWMFFILPLNSRPSNVYPDSIRVVYEDGDEEIYQSGTTSLAMAALHTNESSTDGLMMGLNRTAAEEILNRPGDIYESYDGDECTIDQSNNDITPQVRSGGNSSESVSSYFDAEHILLNPNSGGAMAAGKIEDGYAVLKVEDFRINTDQLVAVWKMLSSQAKESGVNKLIIDISNNGGGIGSSASTLAQLMYPSVEYEYFRKSWDFVISKPMEVYNNTVVPIYEEIANTINALNESDYQGFIDTLTEEQFTSINEALCSMQTICNGIECAGDQNSCLKACDSVDNLISVMESFETYRSPPVLQNVALTLYNLINTINPGRVRATADLSDVDLNGYRTVNRGGVLTNVSLPFTMDPIEYYYQAVASSYQTLHKFDEYIIVSNGVSGSATALFASLVNQLWKNRNISLVKSSLVSVSYGGLNTEGDVMMAGFPASVQNVHLEDPLLAAGILYIFNTLLQGDSTFSPVISSALLEYANVLPVPPYFANSLPKLPVLNYYSTFMGEGALPLQYVKMPADKHLPFYYTQTTIDDAGDLPSLYDKASKLFTASINSSDFNLTSGNNDSSNGTDADSSSSSDKEVSSNAGTVGDQSSSTLTMNRCNVVVVLLTVAVGYMFV